MRLPLLLSGAALLAMSVGASAEEAAAESADGLIIVTAPRDNGYVVNDTSSATRTDTPLLDIPQSIDVFNRQRLNDQAFLSITDALRYIPGTTVGQGEGNRDQPTIRGNNSTSSFFVDGLRDDVQYFRDFYNTERLEVLKGPNAVTFGRGGGGGVINRVSKAPVIDSGFIGGSVMADTWGGWRLAADINQPLNQSIAVRLNAVYEQGDNNRDFYELERYGINPVVGFKLGERGSLVLGYEYVYDDRVADRGIPSENGRPLEGYYDTFFGDPDINRSKFDANIVSTGLDYELTDNLLLRWRGRYGDYNKYYGNVFPSGPVVNGRFNMQAYEDYSDRQNLLGQTDLVWTVATGTIQHTVLAGIELGRQTTEVTRTNGFFSQTQPTLTASAVLQKPFIAPQAYFRFGPGSRNSQTVANSFAVFVQDQIAIGEHFEILAGIRYDRFSLDFTNLLVTGGDFQRTDNLWSPRLGLVYKPVANASLYFSYSKSFLPQSGDQFNSLDASTAALEPESFENIELGGKWDVSPDFNMTLAIYQLDRTNTRAPGATPGVIELTGRQRSKGLEFSANGNILDNWELSAGFALQDAELLDATTAAPAGRTVPLVPHTQLAVWSRYNIIDPVGVGLGVVYQSSSYASISNAVVLPAYTRVDAAAFWQIAKGLEVQVNIENLFNIQYFPTSHTDNNISTGLPRTARFTVRTSF